MANDPNTIQYVIQEDGFWYVASKDRTPGVPEITVSAKGVANGLSTEYNDGYDFGPDSYNPSITSGVPLTQTSGIEEAWGYAALHPTSFNIQTGTYKILPIHLSSGFFICTKSFTIDLQPIVYNGTSYLPGNVQMNGSGLMSTYIIVNLSSGYLITINPTMNNIDFYFADFQPLGGKSPYAPAGFMFYDSVAAANGTDFTNPLHLQNIDVGNGKWSDHSFYFRGMKYATLVDYSEYGSGTSEIYIEADGSIAIFGGFQTGGTFPSAFLELDFFSVYNYVSRYNIPMPSNSGFEVIPSINVYGGRIVGFALGGNVYNIGMYGGALSTPANSTVLTMLSGVSALTINRVTAKGLNANHPPITLAASGITITAIEADTVTNNTGQFAINNNGFPQTTVSGTTAGSFVASMPEQGATYKKVIIYLNGYENDSTTAQTYTYPVPFSTVAEITANTASVPVVSTSLTEFSIAPDTTTAYTGIIVIEGY